MKDIAELMAIRDRMKGRVEARKDQSGYKVVVGMATCGIAAGARPVMTKMLEEIQTRNLRNVKVSQTGCIGICRLEPIVEVYEPDGDKYTYVKIDATKMVRIINEHLVNGIPVREYMIGQIR